MFLVDNGWHMRDHWESANLVVQTLGMQIGPLDKDGLDLLFTFDPGDYAKRNVKNFGIPTAFQLAMEKAKPGDNMYMYKTSMAQSLRNVLRKYLNDGMPKKLTLIVLTTGIWDGVKDDAEMEVAAAIREMVRKRKGFYTDRWFGIEFVSFGNEPSGLTRLQEFDDNMTMRFGIP
jgi:hypothetical protein